MHREAVLTPKVVCLTFDKTDPVQRRKAHRCIELLIDDAAALVSEIATPGYLRGAALIQIGLW